jgi:hypothetical protein
MTASTTLNMAVLAPMPSASVRAATMVKPGFAQSACGVAEVPLQNFDPANGPHIANGLL